MIFIDNPYFESPNFCRSPPLFFDNNAFEPPPFSLPTISCQFISAILSSPSSTFILFPAVLQLSFSQLSSRSSSSSSVTLLHPSSSFLHPTPSSNFNRHPAFPSSSIILLQLSSCLSILVIHPQPYSWLIYHPPFLQSVLPRYCRMNRYSDSFNRSIRHHPLWCEIPDISTITVQHWQFVEIMLVQNSPTTPYLIISLNHIWVVVHMGALYKRFTWHFIVTKTLYPLQIIE